ncbi:MAG: SDR family NAD(P)-dependent oxidoreductase [SAR202 cluster bacterium]|nr:SDR family NAD(P)-dependent oxidoreductase [SAR202 cluster bacterium]
MLGDLMGKTALVTGAGSGIGRGIAIILAEQGASVAVTDLDLDGAEGVADEIAGTGKIALHLDVTDRNSIEQAVRRVISEWGELDILVNNAGVRSSTPAGAAEDSDEDWDLMFAVNVKGVVNCCNAAVPHFKERRYGKIINIASMGGHASRRTPGSYATSKAAVLRYTKGLADVLAPYNINVNSICPGAVWTRFQEAGALSARQRDPELAQMEPEQIFRQRYDPMIPLGRVQTPEDIGKMAAFLASEDARNVTGQCIHVDGGVILRD